MNMSQFERAQVAGFAYRQAKMTGSIEAIKAICYVLRNRLKAGWGEGSWLSILGLHPMVEGNLKADDPDEQYDPQERLLQLIVRDIDDIYLGQSEDDTRAVVGDALYFHRIDAAPREWFVENIVRKPEEHPRIAQVATFAFFK